MGGIAMALLEEMLAKTLQNMALLEERKREGNIAFGRLYYLIITCRTVSG